MQHAPDRNTHFPTLAAMRPPSIAKALAWMLLIGIAIA
ncbi:RND transporter, partial [Xanthomonas hortorum pv. taraxaci]|nr:RND transporter [Xanthomonas hortorum pv. taraxaci]